MVQSEPLICDTGAVPPAVWSVVRQVLHGAMHFYEGDVSNRVRRDAMLVSVSFFF